MLVIKDGKKKAVGWTPPQGGAWIWWNLFMFQLNAVCVSWLSHQLCGNMPNPLHNTTQTVQPWVNPIQWEGFGRDGGHLTEVMPPGVGEERIDIDAQ